MKSFASLIVVFVISLYSSFAGTLHAGTGVVLGEMDPSAEPCKDFFQYANGTWVTKNPIPADRSSYSSFSEVFDRNLNILHQILEDASKDKAASEWSVVGKVGAFYKSGMDTAKIEAERAKPLEEELARIDQIKDTLGMQEAIARYHQFGVFPAFQLQAIQDFKESTEIIGMVYQGGLGMPDRDYYVSDDQKMKAIRKEYVAHIAKMFQLLGEKKSLAEMEATKVMDFETQLAKRSMTQVEQRDPNAIYHKMTVADMDALTPSWPWPRYFTKVGLSNPGSINVAQLEFLKEVGRMVADHPLDDWKAYLRWQLIHATAGRLSSDFVAEDFHFNETVVRGTKELKPRWKRVVETTDQRLGEALGQLFVETAFSAEAKKRALDLVTNVKAALRDRIQSLDWMGDETKKQALRKLDAIRVKVGYPDKWRDYSGLMVDRNSYVLNVMQADAFEFQRNLNKIGNPVNRDEWQMTPPTVNAYYDWSFNDINFPAGILQPPFFDGNADDASNYGGIGMVIGHELTHGFDDQGRQFDAEGNLKNWWTAEDEKRFNERAAMVDSQYSGYVAIDNLHVNGKLTLGENIADIGGLKIAYLALKKSMEGNPPAEKIDGFTPEQRFFLSFAQIWHGQERPEQIRLRVTTNPHSPNRFRVLGPLADTPEFSSAFGCKESGSTQTQIW